MAEYEELLGRLIEAEVILDEGMAYWDVRPSKRFPTLEIRIADVMPDVESVVAVAALARALVATYGSDEALKAPTYVPNCSRRPLGDPPRPACPAI